MDGALIDQKVGVGRAGKDLEVEVGADKAGADAVAVTYEDMFKEIPLIGDFGAHRPNGEDEVFQTR